MIFILYTLSGVANTHWHAIEHEACRSRIPDLDISSLARKF